MATHLGRNGSETVTTEAPESGILTLPPPSCRRDLSVGSSWGGDGSVCGKNYGGVIAKSVAHRGLRQWWKHSWLLQEVGDSGAIGA